MRKTKNSGNSSRLVGQLTAGFADSLDEQMEEGEEAFAAIVCVWTTKGARWHLATSTEELEAVDWES